MALRPWRRADLFFQPEAYFSFAIEFIKSYTDITIGYELYLKPGDPQNFYPPYMFGASLACIVIAIIADSYVRKYFTIIFGVVFLFIGCVFFLLCLVLTKYCFYFNMASIICLLVYVATSEIRNVFLLEQIEDYAHLRIIIFVLIYIRLIWRGITSLHMIFPAIYLYTRWAIVIAALIAVVYIVLLIWKGSKVELEPEHLNIFCKCVACLFNALKKRKGLEYLKNQEHETESAVPATEATNAPLARRRWSKKKSHAYQETIYLVKILPWLFLGALVSNLTFFILTVTAAQCEFSSGGSDIGFIFVRLWSLLFELLFLPFVEFVFIRYAKAINGKHLALTMLGYLLLIVSALILLGIHLYDHRFVGIREKSNIKDEIKKHSFAKLILVNLSPSPLSVSSNWSGSFSVPGSLSTFKKIYKMDKVVNVTRELISSGDNYKTNVSNKITLFNGSLTSYYTFNNRLLPFFVGPDGKAQPNPIPSNGSQRMATIRRLDCITSRKECNVSGRMQMTAISVNKNEKSPMFILKGNESYFSVALGTMDIHASIFTDQHYKIVSAYPFKEHTYLLVASAGVSVQEKSIHASLIDLGPGVVSIEEIIEELRSGIKVRYILIVQIFIASLGYCFSTVSYYAFVFYESPPKLRSTTMTTILMLNFLTAGAYGYAKANLIFIAVHVAAHVVFFAAFCYPVWKASRQVEHTEVEQ